MRTLRQPVMGSLASRPQVTSTTTTHTKGMHTTVMQQRTRNIGICAHALLPVRTRAAYSHALQVLVN